MILVNQGYALNISTDSAKFYKYVKLYITHKFHFRLKYGSESQSR